MSAPPAVVASESLYEARQKIYPRGVVGRFARLRTLAGRGVCWGCSIRSPG